MLKISEVYERQTRTTNERPDGSEYVSFGTCFDTRDILINKDYIVAVHPHTFRSTITEDKITESFPEGIKFSILVMNGNSFRKSELLVVGSFDKFSQLLGT